MTLLCERYSKGATHRGYAEPQQCPLCRAMSFFWTNRNGETLCTGCDALKYPEEREWKAA